MKLHRSHSLSPILQVFRPQSFHLCGAQPFARARLTLVLLTAIVAGLQSLPLQVANGEPLFFEFIGVFTEIDNTQVPADEWVDVGDPFGGSFVYDVDEAVAVEPEDNFQHYGMYLPMSFTGFEAVPDGVYDNTNPEFRFGLVFVADELSRQSPP